MEWRADRLATGVKFNSAARGAFAVRSFCPRFRLVCGRRSTIDAVMNAESGGGAIESPPLPSPSSPSARPSGISRRRRRTLRDWISWIPRAKLIPKFVSCAAISASSRMSGKREEVCLLLPLDLSPAICEAATNVASSAVDLMPPPPSN